MVWYLLLAHFLGDFVFQTDWMVRRRDNLWVLSLHAGVHFALMLLLVGPSRSVVWPYLFITYVWFIIERLFNLSNTDYLQNINITKFSRMLSRVGLVSLFLLIQSWATSGLAIVFSNPYSQTEYHRRSLLMDISVCLFAIIFLSWALR